MQSVALHLHHLASAADLRVTRFTSAALCLLLLLGLAAPQYVSGVLGLVPGYTVSNYYLWTFVTAGLLHTSLLIGSVNIAVFVAVSPFLERVWGSRSWLLYLLLVDVCIQVVLFALMISLYAVTESELFLFRSVCGFSGVNAAIAVAMKQRWADQQLVTHSNLALLHSVRYEHLPFIVCSASVLLWLSGWLGVDVLLVLLGTVISFVYLRFYSVDADTGEVGDLRSDFSFASLFPRRAGRARLRQLAGRHPLPRGHEERAGVVRAEVSRWTGRRCCRLRSRGRLAAATTARRGVQSSRPAGREKKAARHQSNRRQAAAAGGALPAATTTAAGSGGVPAAAAAGGRDFAASHCYRAAR